MKSPLSTMTLAILATLVLSQCATDPPPGRPQGYGSAGDTQYGSYGSSLAPVYRLASYPPPNTPPSPPPLGLLPPAPTGMASLPRPSAPSYGPQPHLMFVSGSDVAPKAPPIHAESYILVNADNGMVLAARNADTRRGVASTQKILTALIVAESGDLDRRVQVAASDVAVEPSKLGVKPGEVYTRRDLLIAFLVKSSNDVANVLARDNAGSTSAFAAKMTYRARAAGAVNSNFANPHGLTAGGQYSTARDMARIAWTAYQNPVVRDAIRRKYYTFRFNNGRAITLENTNELLGRMPECNGMKTGYTVAAGRCLLSTAHAGSRDVILVQLGTKTKYIWNDGATLMRYGLR